MIKKSLLIAVSVTVLTTLGTAVALNAAPLNRFTIGKNNVEAIKYNIVCKREESLASLDQGMQSSISDYREFSYLLATAVHNEMGNKDKAGVVIQRWRDEDAQNKSWTEEEFVIDAEHFVSYFAGKRFKKIGSKTCG